MLLSVARDALSFQLMPADRVSTDQPAMSGRFCLEIVL